MVDLGLHRRLETVFAEDDELFELHRRRQDRLKALQRLYRYRLDFVIKPARELLRRREPAALLPSEQESAIDALRRFDAEHLARIAAVQNDFETEVRPAERPAVARQREELAEILGRSAAVAIAGGHVAVLLNRIRLFALPDLVTELPIFAWSAGAMALSERIVLFHDSPPQGAGSAEILDIGLGLATGIVPLPHASKRLRLGDPIRLALFARRFAPDLCVLLEPGTAVERIDGRWCALESGEALAADGTIQPLEAA